MSTYKQSKCIIIFSGFNPRAVVAFLRTIRKHNVKYAIIAKSKEDAIFLTDYNNKVFSVRKTTELDLDDIITAIRKVQNRIVADQYVIAPTSEALNRFVLNNRDVFRKYCCDISLVDKDLYVLISDKFSFSRLCLKNNITVPEEQKFSYNMQLPVVAKPKKYFSEKEGTSLSPYIIKSVSDLECFVNKNRIEEYYFQEYVDGRSLYLLYYFTKNGRIYKHSQENLVQQADGKSMIYAVASDFHFSEESHKYEAMLKKLNFHGLIMVEVKQRNGKSYMIEANPRFWGPSQLFVDAGHNLFEVWLQDNGFLQTPIDFKQNRNDIKYFWFGGLLQNYRNGKKLTFHAANEINLMNKLPSLLKHDVYRRPDTMQVFIKELSDGY